MPINEAPASGASAAISEDYAATLNRLRAAVLGAGDGIVSTAAIVMGVAGATSDAVALLVAGVAGMSAGALSMAVGEYVSVSAQRDSERAHALQAPGASRGEVPPSGEPVVLVNPWHAATASFAAFVAGALVPVLAVVASPPQIKIPVTVAAVLVALVVTGVISAKVGGAPVGRAVLRVVLGGVAAMGITYGIGTLVGVGLG